MCMNDMLSDDDHSLLCSGFMVLKPTVNNMKFFNDNIDISDLPGDQVYVNNIKSDLKYEMLPLDKFPNGRLHQAARKPTRPSLQFHDRQDQGTKNEKVR